MPARPSSPRSALMPSRCDHLDVQHHDAGRPRVADVTSVAAVRLAPVIVTSAPVAIVRGQLMLVPADSAKPAMAAAIDLARDMRGIQAPSPCQDGSGMLAGVDNGPRQPLMIPRKSPHATRHRFQPFVLCGPHFLARLVPVIVAAVRHILGPGAATLEDLTSQWVLTVGGGWSQASSRRPAATIRVINAWNILSPGGFVYRENSNPSMTTPSPLVSLKG
jgi:hypothetical protein